MAEAETLETGETRVVEAAHIEGQDDFEVIVKHRSDYRTVTKHRFIFEFYKKDDWEHDGPRVLFVAWEPLSGSILFLEDLQIIGYVEQYLRHHGIGVSRLLDDGMYRPIDTENTDEFDQDAALEITPP